MEQCIQFVSTFDEIACHINSECEVAATMERDVASVDEHGSLIVDGTEIE